MLFRRRKDAQRFCGGVWGSGQSDALLGLVSGEPPRATPHTVETIPPSSTCFYFLIWAVVTRHVNEACRHRRDRPSIDLAAAMPCTAAGDTLPSLMNGARGAVVMEILRRMRQKIRHEEDVGRVPQGSLAAGDPGTMARRTQRRTDLLTGQMTLPRQCYSYSRSIIRLPASPPIYKASPSRHHPHPPSPIPPPNVYLVLHLQHRPLQGHRRGPHWPLHQRQVRRRRNEKDHRVRVHILPHFMQF